MEAFRITLITVGAFLVGVACAAAGLALNTKAVNSGSAFKSSRPRMSGAGFPLAHVGRAPGDPDAPVGYSALGIAKINGTRIRVYSYQNGTKLGDMAGRGQGFADVFDSAGHLMRRFIFRENLNSPPQIIEFVYMPARSAKRNGLF
jgi:hypothetical protein